MWVGVGRLLPFFSMLVDVGRHGAYLQTFCALFQWGAPLSKTSALSMYQVPPSLFKTVVIGRDFVLLPKEHGIYEEEHIWSEHSVTHMNSNTIIMTRIDVADFIKSATELSWCLRLRS